MVCPPRITRCLLWPNATRLEGLCQRSVRHRVRHSFEYSKLWLRRNRASHYPIYTFLSLSIYIYVSHRRICRHIKSTCTIRISADYGNPFNGKSRIRVYKCVYTLAIQFRNLSRGLSCTSLLAFFSPDAPVSNESEPHSPRSLYTLVISVLLFRNLSPRSAFLSRISRDILSKSSIAKGPVQQLPLCNLEINYQRA